METAARVPTKIKVTIGLDIQTLGQTEKGGWDRENLQTAQHRLVLARGIKG